jgi:hypothetical protein
MHRLNLILPTYKYETLPKYSSRGIGTFIPRNKCIHIRLYVLFKRPIEVFVSHKLMQ